MRISYSFGMVDLLHFGHINALRLASEGADLSVFGLVSDAAADAWFGAHVSDEAERRAVLESIRYVDRVVPQRTFDPIDNLRQLHEEYPEAQITLYHGDDFGVIPARRYLESIGGSVVTFGYYDKLSPQRILDTLNRNEIPNRQVSNLISTKANTLFALQKLVTRSRIEEGLVVTAGEFAADADGVAGRVAAFFGDCHVVIRSSSRREDAFEASNAGHFKSVIGTGARDGAGVRAAIREVIESYRDAGDPGAPAPGVDPEEQVLIQRQTERVRMSGVIFTRDIQRNRPYYVINYDETGSTDAVTAGAGGDTVWMIHSIAAERVPEKWRQLIGAVREIEEILPGMLLDIEFALTQERGSLPVIFQVRPLAAAYKFGRGTGMERIEEARQQAREGYRRLREKRGIACYSDMAFWNPAEIIGGDPRNLDHSLYRQIITKSAWNEGLVPLGYTRVERELMYRFGNKPYINLEYSFEALIPAAVSRELAEKLRDIYLRILAQDMWAHDKIEFEIAVNCFDFTMEEKLARLAARFPGELGEGELQELGEALRQLTERVIVEYPRILERDLRDLRELERIRLEAEILTGAGESPAGGGGRGYGGYPAADFRVLSGSVKMLLDAVSRFGTPQFARQARCAFIARSLGRSLLESGYLDADTYHGFLATIHTVAEDYDRDRRAAKEGRLAPEVFRVRYGHLRAGTYDIRSPRYDRQDAGPDGATPPPGGSETGDEVRAGEENVLDEAMKGAIARAMEATGFVRAAPEELLRFLRLATEQREYFKFIFTRSLSDAIELIRRMGEAVQIPAEDLSYLEVPEIYAAAYYEDADRLREFWQLIIGRRRELYHTGRELILPSVILSERDFDYIENPVSRPNFITQKRVTAEVAALDGARGSLREQALAGRIVCIEKADPGFDWIFSCGIAGLLTRYGGAASHMAVRCAEFQIPAAIGCGARIYGQASRARQITLDCRHERVTVG